MPLEPVFQKYNKALRIGSIQPAPGGCRFVVEMDNGRRVPGRVAFTAPHVVRITLGDHAKGAANPFVEAGEPTDPGDLRQTTQGVSVEGKTLRVRLQHEPLGLAVERPDGTVLWRSSLDDMDQKGNLRVLPFGTEGDPVQRVTAAFAVEPVDHFLGFGEKFCRLDKLGLAIESANSNAGGATSERAYKNVPFFLSTRGFGVLFNTTCHLRHDVANPALSILSYVVTVESPVLDFFLMDGPHPKDVLGRYADLTGRAPVPPLWTFGLWVSRFYYEKWATLEEACDGFRARGIPADVVNTDTYWMKGDRLSDMQWDEERFPDPARHLAALRDKGFRVCVWEFPYIAEESPLWQEAWDKGYLVRRPDGSPCNVQTTLPVTTHHLEGFRGVGSLMHVYKQPLVKPGTLIDFTNPAAVAWWKDLHKARMREGVAVFKTDFGEDVPEDAVFHDGRTGKEVHNLYPLLYQQATVEATEEELGYRLTWGRSGWAGGQRFPIHWGGDPTTSFRSLAGTLRAALSYGVSGVPFWSHDIGGFAGPPPSEALFVRWAQFGLFSSHSRLHGTTPREPWEFGERACAIFARYAKLRYRLLPYLYASAVDSAAGGVPMMRACHLEFPEDPTCRALDSQYLLGRDLLVAPILNERGDVDVYLPEGEWLDYWSGDIVTGPRWLCLRGIPLDTLPVYLRADGVLPQAPDMNHTEERPWDEITFEVFPVGTIDRSFTLPDGERLRFRCRRGAKGLAVRVDGPDGAYRLTPRGVAGAGEPPALKPGTEIHLPAGRP